MAESLVLIRTYLCFMTEKNLAMHGLSLISSTCMIQRRTEYMGASDYDATPERKDRIAMHM